LERLLACANPIWVALLLSGRQRGGGMRHDANGLQFVAQGLSSDERLRPQQLARLVGEQIAVPRTALYWQRLRFEQANGQFKQGPHLSRVEQGGLLVRLGLVKAVARLGGGVEEAAEGVVLGAGVQDPVSVGSQGEKCLRSGGVAQQRPRLPYVASLL
jgi:hypothetical protein